MTLILIGGLVWLLFSTVRLRSHVRYLQEQIVADIVRHHAELEAAEDALVAMQEEHFLASSITFSLN